MSGSSEWLRMASTWFFIKAMSGLTTMAVPSGMRLTGSTRFVCIPIPDRMLPLDWLRQHRDAIWARAVAEFRAIAPGEEPWDRPTEELQPAAALACP